MDLASNNIEILIQWERADKHTDVSSIWVKDFNTYTDKLVFGWPLDSEVMEVSGPLKFSVRFVMYDDDKNIIYSLSTLTTQVTINPGLNFDASELQTDQEIYNMIFNRIQNSNIESNEDIEVPLPVFVLSKFSPAFGVEELLILDGEEYKIDVNQSIKLEAQAYKPSTHGVMTYSFAKNSNGDMVDTNNYDIEEKMVKVADGSTYNSYITYYDISGQPKVVDIDTDLIDNKFKDDNEYYEKICEASIKKAGTYYFAATNTYNAKNSMALATKGYYIPGPSSIEIIPNEQKSYIIYSNSNQKTFTSSNIKVNKLDDENNRTNLGYVWGKGRINPETQKEEFVTLNNEESTDISYTPAEEGSYILKVLARRNNATIETLSNILYAYNEAIVPVVEIIADDNEYKVGETIECRVTNLASMKNLSYKWYYKNGSENINITQAEAPEKCIIPQGALGKKIYCDIMNYNGFVDNKAVTTIETNFIGSAE